MDDKLPKYDWDAIERDYRAGVLPLGAICSKYGVSDSRLRQVAKSKKWTRMNPDVAKALGFASVTNPKGPEHSIYTEEDLKKAATLDMAGVLIVHRKDIGRLRNLTNILVDRLGLYLSGTDPKDMLPFIGGKESPADLLEKLSRVQVRGIELERQAFGLSAMPQNPTGNNDEPGGNQVLAEMKELLERVDAMAAKKAE